MPNHILPGRGTGQSAAAIAKRPGAPRLFSRLQKAKKCDTVVERASSDASDANVVDLNLTFEVFGAVQLLRVSFAGNGASQRGNMLLQRRAKHLKNTSGTREGDL